MIKLELYDNNHDRVITDQTVYVSLSSVKRILIHKDYSSIYIGYRGMFYLITNACAENIIKAKSR